MKTREVLFSVASLVCLCLFLSAPGARAQKKNAKVEEADSRFIHGVELFNDEEYGAALAEFHWAYNLQPHYAVLYNIAVCYVKLGRYVDALKYYDQYLKDAGNNISQDRKNQVNDEIKYVKSLMGSIDVKTNLNQVSVLIDGNEAAKTPLLEPILVPAGSHTIEVALAGYIPQKEEITVATGVTIEKSYTLVKDQRMSTITISSTAPYSTIYVDGREMGKSPWTGDLLVGEHEVKVAAPGYRDAIRPIVIHPDEEREIEIEMDISGKPGKLTITANTQGADIWMEERSIGTIPLKSYKLPPGIYHVSISKDGYKGWEGDVSVKEGALTKIDIAMDKTSGKLHAAIFSVTTSLALASIAAAGTLGYLTLKKQEEFDDFPKNLGSAGTGDMYALQQQYNDIAQEGKRLAIATDVCIAAAAVTGVTSIFLAFFTQFKKPESKASIHIGAAMTGEEKGMSLSGLWRF
jgi:hypothetical protein